MVRRHTTRHTTFLHTLTVVACAATKDVLHGGHFWDAVFAAEEKGLLFMKECDTGIKHGLKELEHSGEVWDEAGESVMVVRLTPKGKRVYNAYRDLAKKVRKII